MTGIAPRIVVDEATRSGRPVIKGTRVPVGVLVGQVAAGLTAAAVVDESGVTRDDVLAALVCTARGAAEAAKTSTQATVPGYCPVAS